MEKAVNYTAINELGRVWKVLQFKAFIFCVCFYRRTPFPNTTVSFHSLTMYLSQPPSSSLHVCMLLFVLFKHNMLIYFIAYTYFTTFPDLEPEEDQTSSVVNFLQEHSLESMPHRKSLLHAHTETHMQTWWAVWKRREKRLYIQLIIFTIWHPLK